jgi:hypothetical protein
MCRSCGCGQPLDDDGSEDNVTAVDLKEDLTEEALRRPAEAQRISVEEVRPNLEASTRRTGRRWVPTASGREGSSPNPSLLRSRPGAEGGA